MTVSHEVNAVVDRILFLAFSLQVLSPVFVGQGAGRWPRSVRSRPALINPKKPVNPAALLDSQSVGTQTFSMDACLAEGRISGCPGRSCSLQVPRVINSTTTTAIVAVNQPDPPSIRCVSTLARSKVRMIALKAPWYVTAGQMLPDRRRTYAVR